MRAAHQAGKPNQRKAWINFLVHVLLVILLTLIFTLTFIFGIPVNAQTYDRCPHFAATFYTFDKVDTPQAAECEPDKRIAKIDIHGGELILDMGRGNEIIDGPGADFYFYERLNPPGIWLDLVEVSVAHEDSLGNPEIFKTVFVWGDDDPTNNGLLPATYLPELPERQISSSDLHKDTGISIDILSDDYKGYRFIRFRSYLLAPNTVNDPKPEIDAIERIHDALTKPTSEPATPAPTAQPATPEPATVTPVQPTEAPTNTMVPTTVVPTQAPTNTMVPTAVVPTQAPTNTVVPTAVVPTQAPTNTVVPTAVLPTEAPTNTVVPTAVLPTEAPTNTVVPTAVVPTQAPANTVVPTQAPANTVVPTAVVPTQAPANTVVPTAVVPTQAPANTVVLPTAVVPTQAPANTVVPTTIAPTEAPTARLHSPTPKPELPRATASLTNIMPQSSATSQLHLPPVPQTEIVASHTPVKASPSIGTSTVIVTLTNKVIPNQTSSPTRETVVSPPPGTSGHQPLNCEFKNIVSFIVCNSNDWFGRWNKAGNVVANIVALVLSVVIGLINYFYSTKSTSFIYEQLSSFPLYSYHDKNWLTFGIVMIRIAIFILCNILNIFLFLMIAYFLPQADLTEQTVIATLLLSFATTLLLHGWIWHQAIGLRWLSNASSEEIKAIFRLLKKPIDNIDIDNVLEKLDNLRNSRVIGSYKELDQCFPTLFQRTEFQHHVQSQMLTMFKQKCKSLFSRPRQPLNTTVQTIPDANPDKVLPASEVPPEAGGLPGASGSLPTAPLTPGASGSLPASEVPPEAGGLPGASGSP